MQLYVLGAQYAQILEALESGDYENDQCLKDTLEGLEGEINDKVENMCKLMRSIEADEIALKAEEKRLAAKRMTLEDRRESIKDYMEKELIKVKIDKVKTPIFSVGFQNNKPSVEVDETKLEELKSEKEIWVQHPDTLDKNKCYELLKAGRVFDGLTLKTTRSIRIR